MNSYDGIYGKPFLVPRGAGAEFSVQEGADSCAVKLSIWARAGQGQSLVGRPRSRLLCAAAGRDGRPDGARDPKRGAFNTPRQIRLAACGPSVPSGSQPTGP